MSVSEIPVSTKPASADAYSHKIPSTIGYFAAFVALGLADWFIVGASLGSMFFPWLIGQMFEPVGPPVMIWTISAIILAALVIFGLLMYAIQVGPSWLKGPAEPQM